MEHLKYSKNSKACRKEEMNSKQMKTKINKQNDRPKSKHINNYVKCKKSKHTN